jgi:hypothetical protein
VVKCDHCKGSGWAWDNHAAKKVRENGRWKIVPCRKWRHCGWCSGAGQRDEWKCDHCCGSGWMSDDSYSAFGCPWCDGKGCRKDAPPGWKRTTLKRKPDPKKNKKPRKKAFAETMGDRWDLI